LRAIFEFFFKYRPAVFAQGEFAFGARWPLLLIAVAVLAVAVPAVLTYATVRGKSSARDRRILAALRIASIAVLLLCLFRPMLVLNAAVPQRNFVGVIIDDSRSMQIADRGGRERADYVRDSITAKESALLKSLRARFQVRLFRMGATLERLDDSTGLHFDQPETHLGEALDGARRELDAVPLSGLVVLTDGADNASTPIADELRTLRAKSVPVFTVGIGAERFDKDIEIRRVESARTVLKGSTLVADLLVRQRGFAGQKVPLVIEDDGRMIGHTDIVLPQDGDVAPIRVTAKLNDAGARTLTFRIPQQPGEQVTQNNQQQTLVQVRGGRQKILYVEGEPRSEMRFIRAAVEDDSVIQLVALQRTADNKFLRLSVDGPDELAAGFPKSRAELFQYRAVVLGSIEASFFSHDQLSMLADFVGVRGGGLLLLGGRRAFAEGGFTGTPLAEVMPVVIEGPAVPDSLTFFADLATSLTPSGESHVATQVTPPDKPAADRWRTLPTVSSVNRIRRLKPGAVTLVTGKTPRAGRAGAPGGSVSGYEQPVLVYQRYGRGLSVALPIQDSWTWKMAADIPVDDPTFDTFWRQMLRWLVNETPGRVSVTVSADQAQPHTSVEVRAEVVDSAFVKLNDAQVTAHITGPSGVTRDVPLEWAVDRDGEYRATFSPDEPGIFSVRVEAVTSAGTVRDSTAVRAAELNTEFVGAEMRAPLLKRIARETGGRYYTADNTKTLAEDVALSKRGVTVVNVMDLWDMPFNFLLLVGLLSAEWAYRKRRGLA
jgi:hypothetical protein